MSVEALERFESGRILKWISNGMPVEYHFGSSVIAVPLRSGTGILVVEPASDDAPHNASIIASDGRTRKQIRNPEAANGAICFADAYYVGNELTLFIVWPSRQMGCVIEETGTIVRLYESR